MGPAFHLPYEWPKISSFLPFSRNRERLLLILHPTVNVRNIQHSATSQWLQYWLSIESWFYISSWNVNHSLFTPWSEFKIGIYFTSILTTYALHPGLMVTISESPSTKEVLTRNSALLDKRLGSLHFSVSSVCHCGEPSKHMKPPVLSSKHLDQNAWVDSLWLIHCAGAEQEHGFFLFRGPLTWSLFCLVH